MGSLFKLWIPGKRMYFLTLSHSDGRMSFCWELEYGVVQCRTLPSFVSVFFKTFYSVYV